MHKLEESWHGPYTVTQKVGRVNYKVDVGHGRTKVLQINNMKRFYVREEEVMRLAVVFFIPIRLVLARDRDRALTKT